MKVSVKKIMAVLVGALMLIGIASPAMSVDVSAATKPARVKLSKISKNTGTKVIKITWGKAKGAKKYQVYMKTSKGKYAGKYIKIKTLGKSKRSYSRKVSYDVKYSFKVRAVNGSKRGSFSRVKSAIIKNPSADARYKKGYKGTIESKIENGPKVEDVTVTKVSADEEGCRYYFTTGGGKKGVLIESSDGKTIKVKVGDVYGKAVGDPPEDTDDWYFGHKMEGWGFMNYEVAALKEGVEVYWTLDGTEPKKDNEVRTGTIPVLEKDYQLQLCGTVKNGDGLEAYTDQPDRFTFRTASTGNGYIEIGRVYAGFFNEEKPFTTWAKAYKNGEYIGEYYESFPQGL